MSNESTTRVGKGCMTAFVLLIVLILISYELAMHGLWLRFLWRH